MADEKKEEKKAEKEAEAEVKLDIEPSREEAGSNPDEEAQPEAMAEEETPAEVEAINTDNETATQANETKEEPVAEKKEENQPKVDQPMVEKPEPSGKFKDLIKEIEGLTTIELAELVKELEERFGVSAAAPVAMAGAPAAGAAVEAEEEKANYSVVLADSGTQKIAVIKALREINQELGLKEAKDIADTPPKEILKDAPKEKAEEAKKKLEAAGAKVELK